MRLCGDWCLLLLLLFIVLCVKAEQRQPKERRYYIAAVEIDWTYSGTDAQRFGSTYKKVVFREYEEGFRQAKAHPSWLGLLGPTLRAEEGETLVITFRNMASGEYSIHPHGIAYGKQSEGAYYFDNTSQKEKRDDLVRAGEEHVYYWEVTSEVSPQKDDPSCLTYSYISHRNVVEDYNSGLIGTLLVCKPGRLDVSGQQVGVHQELVFLFGVFDEKESKNKPSNFPDDNHIKYTINGYTQGSLPDVSICAYTSVSLHFLGMSSEPEVFSVHMNGHVMQQAGHKVSSVGLISGTCTTASMVAVHPGRWLLSSHNFRHIQEGMHGFVDVRRCEGIDKPQRKMTIAQQRQSREWTYYIAAEEIVWDYAPKMPEYTDEDYKLQFLEPSPTRIGRKYKKAVYTLYKNESFTERSETKQRRNELGIVGPVIRAQIRDVIKIVFKNMASRPYSIYPHGLTIEKSQEGVNYPAGGNQSHGVQPGETHTYVWHVVEEDGPLDGDFQCLTRMYHSAVDTIRDIASGLIGPILICKSQSLNVRNVQLKADKEQHAVFAVFDENKSWYMEDNMPQTGDRSKVNKADPDFYNSNVMHSINGYTFESGPLLSFCNGEVATWHVSSMGAQDYIQTATFYGHPFKLNERTEDVLSLYPMTGETITMNMDNIGVWLLASLNTHETTKGVRVKFQDVECFRDYQYEYDDYDNAKEWNEWKPPTLDEIKKEDKEMEKKEEEKEREKEKTIKPDYDTDIYAAEWGIRSLKNQSSEMEQLDLSFLDYVTVDDDVVLNNNEPTGKESILFKTENAESNTTVNQSVINAQNMSVNSNNSFGYKTNTMESNHTHVTVSNLNNVTLSDGESTTFEKASAIFDSSNKSREMTTFNFTLETANGTMARNVSSDGDDVNITGNNIAFISDVVADSSEEILTRGDVFAYVASQNLLEPLETPNDAMLDHQLNITKDNRSFYLNVNMTSNHTNPPTELQHQFRPTKLELTSNSLENALENTTHMNTSKEEFTDSSETLTNNTDSFKTTMENVKNCNSSEDGLTVTNITDLLKNNLTNLDFSNNAVISVGTSDSLETTLENTTHMNTSKEEFTDSSETLTNNTDSFKTTMENVKNCNSSEDGLTLTNITDLLKNNLTNLNFTDIGVTSVGTSDSLETTPENLTDALSADVSVQNMTVKLSTPNASVEVNSDLTIAHRDFNHTTIVKNASHEMLALNQSSSTPTRSSSEELRASESSEEVFIYLQENTTEAIKTKPIKTQHVQNWTYDVTHEIMPVEIPDNILKYIVKETSTSTTPTPKKALKKVTLRHWPQKGQGMKTKKRKEYVPQARTLSFSPRGFNPGMSPRGSRPLSPKPVSDEKDLINNPIVIGVPRPDFSDYELYVPGDKPDHLDFDEHQNVNADEYEYVSYKDPYSSHEDMKHLNLDDATQYYLKNSGPNVKLYFISAEEVEWDYAGYGQKREERSQLINRKTKFTKVVFRRYIDSSFTTPDIRGELDEHLGILGPLIKAEVGQNIMIVFRNKANRPYSLHPNGVSYTKQNEGLSYEDGSKYWHKYDNEVQPNKTFTYSWKVTSMVGPMEDESDCRTWAYYSGVNPEKDIQSGLIGPLLVCREGTLNKAMTNVREFVLLFMTFDESQSWCYEKNVDTMQKQTRRRNLSLTLKENLQFHTINGIIYSLKGLRMYTNQLVRWHLINMGSPKDFQSVHFHGQTFFNKKIRSYKQAVYPLLPGSFATLEMIPSKPGLWQLETEIGSIQQKGMQTLFLVLDDDCYHSLGLESGSVTDDQITAINTRGYWEPHLARLNKQGMYNAWSTEQNNSWIQVDFQRPVVISQIATQGAKEKLYSQYLLKYAISYSNDRRKWIFYKGDSSAFRKIFTGNQEAYDTKTNTFFPPIIGRFIRLHPVDWYSKPTVRMEFYGCQLDGCSVPLGMKSGLIQDHQISASSTATSWYGGQWKASLARLNTEGTINAWQARFSDMKQWLQVELPQIKKITGIVTQGAKSLGRQLYVMSFSLQYSDDGRQWSFYTDNGDMIVKTFRGNTNNDGHVENYIYPPIFSRFIRIIPRSWMNSITMRIELLGCDFE